MRKGSGAPCIAVPIYTAFAFVVCLACTDDCGGGWVLRAVTVSTHSLSLASILSVSFHY